VSLTHEVTIWCDACNTWERSIETAAKARKKLKALGWTRTKATPECTAAQDLCPHCSQDKTGFSDEEIKDILKED
jgi:hypothetical protein